MDSQEEEEGAGAHDTLVPVAVDQAGEARADTKGMSDLCFIAELCSTTSAAYPRTCLNLL